LIGTLLPRKHSARILLKSSGVVSWAGWAPGASSKLSHSEQTDRSLRSLHHKCHNDCSKILIHSAFRG
jgi:hypothetical protein